MSHTLNQIGNLRGFVNKEGTQKKPLSQLGKTFHPTDGHILHNIENDYIPYNEKDDFHKFAEAILRDPYFSKIFDKLEFTPENIGYFKEKYEERESKKFEDFVIDNFIVNKEHKCAIDDIDGKFPEVRTKFEQILMARIDLHKRITKLIIHGLKDKSDYNLLFLLANGNIPYDSKLLSYIMFRQNIEEWSNNLTFDTLINMFTLTTFDFENGFRDIYSKLAHIGNNQLEWILKTTDGPILKANSYQNLIGRPNDNVLYAAILIGETVYPGVLFKLSQNNGNLQPDDFKELGQLIITQYFTTDREVKDIWEQFKQRIQDFINGRGLFNPRNYFINNYSLFQQNVRNHMGITGQGVKKYNFSQEDTSFLPGHRSGYETGLYSGGYTNVNPRI